MQVWSLKTNYRSTSTETYSSQRTGFISLSHMSMKTSTHRNTLTACSRSSSPTFPGVASHSSRDNSCPLLKTHLCSAGLPALHVCCAKADKCASPSRIGTANGVGFYERPPESIRAEELEPPVAGAQRLWDGNTDADAYDEVPQPGRSRTDFDYAEGIPIPLSLSLHSGSFLPRPSLAFIQLLTTLMRHPKQCLSRAEPMSANGRDSGSGYGEGGTGAAAARRFASRTAQSPRAHSSSLLQGMHRSMLAPDSSATAMDIEKAAQG